MPRYFNRFEYGACAAHLRWHCHCTCVFLHNLHILRWDAIRESTGGTRNTGLLYMADASGPIHSSNATYISNLYHTPRAVHAPQVHGAKSGTIRTERIMRNAELTWFCGEKHDPSTKCLAYGPTDWFPPCSAACPVYHLGYACAWMHLSWHASSYSEIFGPVLACSAGRDSIRWVINRQYYFSLARSMHDLLGWLCFLACHDWLAMKRP